MPNYCYKCSNKSCEKFDQNIGMQHEFNDKSKKMCEICNNELDRVFFVPKITLRDNMDSRKRKTSSVYNEIKDMKKKLNEYKSSLKRGEYKE